MKKIIKPYKKPIKRKLCKDGKWRGVRSSFDCTANFKGAVGYRNKYCKAWPEDEDLLEICNALGFARAAKFLKVNHENLTLRLKKQKLYHRTVYWRRQLFLAKKRAAKVEREKRKALEKFICASNARNLHV